jgi:RNA polymerase-binding protein DksA
MGQKKSESDPPRKAAMTSAEMEKFRELLIERRRVLKGNVANMEDQALKASDQDFSVDHMADHGSDNFEQEFTLGLIENEEEQLREINAALERIDDGSFGLCESCQKPVAKERLRAIPFTRLCIECKRKEEERGVEEE